MKRFLGTPTLVLCVLAVSLLLRADSCTTVDRTIETPVSFFVEFELDVRGNTAPTDTVSAVTDLSSPLLAALDEIQSADLPDTVYWTGMSAVFTRSTGFDTTRRVSLTVGAPDSEQLLASTPTNCRNCDIPDNRPGRSALIILPGNTFENEFQLVVTQPGVVALEEIANTALDEFLATGDLADTPLSMVAAWDGDRTEDDPADDFTLRVRLNYQVLDTRSTEVYNP